MKKKYTKPEIITEDVSIAFTGACCDEVSEGMKVGMTNQFICKPSCHLVGNGDYTAA